MVLLIHTFSSVPDELEPSLLEVQHRAPTRYGSISTRKFCTSLNLNRLRLRLHFSFSFSFFCKAIVGTDGPDTRDLESDRPSRSNSSIDITDIDLMTDAFSDKNVIRTKTFLFVADLAHKGPRFHGKKSQLYMWNLLIVS